MLADHQAVYYELGKVISAVAQVKTQYCTLETCYGEAPVLHTQKPREVTSLIVVITPQNTLALKHQAAHFKFNTNSVYQPYPNTAGRIM